MNKPHAVLPETSGEMGFMGILAPMQESIDRFRETSERFSTTCAEIAAEQTAFLQNTLFGSLTEYQELKQTRLPAEFLQVSAEFAWKQAERSLKAYGDFGNQICACWFDALKAAPSLTAKTAKSRTSP